MSNELWPLSKINNTRIEDLPVKPHMPQASVDRIAGDVQHKLDVEMILGPERYAEAVTARRKREAQEEQTASELAAIERSRKVTHAEPHRPYHEFERPKNEAAVLQAAGEYMQQLNRLLIAHMGRPADINAEVQRRNRAFELGESLVKLSQQPLRFPARELHSEPVDRDFSNYVPGYSLCSGVTKDLIAELIARDEHGRKKYGVNLDRYDLTLEQWLQHQKEELLDGAGYAQAALSKLRATTKE